MKHYCKLFFLLIFLSISTSISAKTALAEGQKKVNKLSLVATQSVYNLDNDQLTRIVQPILEGNLGIKALSGTG